MIKEYKAKLDYLKDANQVNKWYSDATHKKIPKIIDNITGADKMLLINAIFLKESGNNLLIKKYTSWFLFWFYNGIQAISLNYTKDNLSALIILPKNKSCINNYIENFTSEIYNMIIGQLTNKKVEISLPKFEFDFNTELSQNFNSLGMKDSFNCNADFSIMKKEKDIYISSIIHKTYIKVDEKGTEATGVNAVVMRCMAAFPPEPIPVMKVDHPFLFIIRNNNLQLDYDITFISKVECLK